MSNKCRNIKKNVQDFDFTFQDMLNTPYLSLLWSIGILNSKYRHDKYYWYNKLKNAYLPYIDDPHFVKKMLDIFNISYNDVKNLPIMKVSSKWNDLYMPFLFDKDENPLILPLRKDGVYPTTAKPEHIKSMEVLDWEKELGTADIEVTVIE